MKNVRPSVSKFIVDIPPLNPLARDYKLFWKEQKRRCIEGYWVEGCWMPGSLYYYGNFARIQLHKDGAQGKSLGRPMIRDVEWAKAYVYMEAKGFSGFEDDTNTCHRFVEELENAGDNYQKLLTKYIKTKRITDSECIGSITDETVVLKKYVPAREYLPKVHSSDLGKALFRNSAKNVIDLEARRLGKDLWEDTKVLTTTGKVKIKDVSVGDQIYDHTGHLTTILDKKLFTDQLQYQITLADGRKVVCGEGHLWTTYVNTGSRSKLKTLETKELYQNYYKTRIDGNFEYKYRLPITKPLNYNEDDLKIDPYYLGLWLGDGTSRTTGVTTMDEEIKQFIYEYAEQLNLQVTTYNNGSAASSYSITSGVPGSQKGANPLLTMLKELGLIQNKHIPNKVYTCSVAYRTKVLEGLLDSDGWCAGAGNYQLTTSYKGLMDTLPRLFQELGIVFKTAIKKTKCNDSTVFNLLTDLPQCKLPRKNKGKARSLFAQRQRDRIAIVNVEPLSVKPSVCIEVDNDDHLFLVDDCVVTHNSVYAANGMINHNFLFDGATCYDTYLKAMRDHEPLTSETLVGGIDAKYTKDLLNKSQIGLDNLPGELIFNGKKYPSPLSKKWEGSFAPAKFIEAKYKVKMDGGWSYKGSRSKIHNRTFADNPLAGNGTGPNLVVIEEMGFMDNLIDSLGALKDATYDGTHKFGVIWCCVCEGTKVWTKNGRLINIEDLTQKDGLLGYDFNENEISKETISYMQSPRSKHCVRLVLDDRSLECSFDHPIAVSNNTFKDASELKKGEIVLVVNHDLVHIYPEEASWYEQRVVLDVVDIGVKDVYNLTADTTNTYMANGIITHNTGTSGEGNKAAIGDAKKVFYDPHSFDCLAFEDQWEEFQDIGYFVPYYMRLDEHRDSEGNIDIESAKEDVEAKRNKILAGKNNKAFQSEIQNNPMKTSEAFFIDNMNLFPIAELTAHKQWLMSNSQDATLQGQCGELVFVQEGANRVEWKPDLKGKMTPCYYGIKHDEDTTGCIQIWEHPQKNENGEIPFGLYLAGTDPYDQDQADSSVSLGSTFIYKTFMTSEGLYEWPVAEYTARPSNAKQHHENVRKLLLYYNARDLYENERNTIKFHFEQKNSLYLLAKQPTILKATENTTVNRQYGIHMTASIKNELELMLRDWLEEERGDDKLNLHMIYSIPLLDELINYNDTGNFDRVIAFMLTILHKHQNFRIKATTKPKPVTEDSFFDRMGKFYKK